ncbi:MAG: DNA polymerase III subunit epsilon [bacterium]|nr:DNA polymerase III subunit epsilon [bacterium]
MRNNAGESGATPGKRPGDFLVAGTDADVVSSYETIAERAETATFGLIENEYVVIDTETTGLGIGEDELIEIGAAIVHGPEVLDTFQTFVNPGRPIPEYITELTSITDADVDGAPSPREAVAMLEEFVGQRTCIAHNAKFDHGFISRYASERSPLSDLSRWIDTVGLSNIALPRLRGHKQDDICEAFGIERGGHRADADVRALCKVWRCLLVALSDMPPEFLGFIAKIAPEHDWPLREAIWMVAGQYVDLDFSMPQLRDRRLREMSEGSAKRSIDADDLGFFDLVPLDVREIEEAFTPEGIVGRMYPSFEHRGEQVEFATGVADAFYNSTHKVIEAGTGVGKSISYLLPAALFAKRNKVRVGIASKTNALLDQLAYRELPLLSKALREKTGEGLSFITLKGYDHYPCLRKLMRVARNLGEDVSDYELNAICSVLTSIPQATWTDLDALSLLWNQSIRSKISCSTDDCLRGKCRYFNKRCFLHGARQRANSADIVVTNHSLLFRDMSLEKKIMPEIRYWVVDEAHGIEDEARAQSSHSVSAIEMAQQIGKLTGPNGCLSAIGQIAPTLEGGSQLMPWVVSAGNGLAIANDLASRMFKLVKGLRAHVADTPYALQELWIDEKLRDSNEWLDIVDLGTEVLEKLDTALNECGKLAAFSEEFGELDEQRVELNATLGSLRETQESLSLILDGTDRDYCYHAVLHSDVDKPGESLVASLIDVGQKLSEAFFPEVNSVVMTSATIAIKDSFDNFAERIGLDRIEPDLWDSCQLKPAEDFYSEMRTLIVSDLPEQRKPGYQLALHDLIRAVHLGVGGGVLTLFTNRREMLDAYDALRPELAEEGIELLCQTSGKSKRQLKDEFTSKEDSCLFALRSFWEGFDAPGRTLRCVLLPKLPFGRPDEPLFKERELRDPKGAWSKFSLPQAIIDTRQAAGRLIRSKTDSGFLVLGDSRLLNRGYGKLFIKAVSPTSPTVVSVDEIEGVLRGLRL